MCREFVFCPSQQFCVPGGGMQEVFAEGSGRAQDSCPAASPTLSKCISQSQSWTRAIPPFPLAVQGSALVSHLLSQLDTDAQLDLLQLGHLPAWACAALPFLCLLYGFGDVPPPECSQQLRGIRRSWSLQSAAAGASFGARDSISWCQGYSQGRISPSGSTEGRETQPCWFYLCIP